ncbi:MAG: DUF433 domain-containing protein [Planctomycetes bacterium]|nr:DUF433 domain-containing protein [Planctomycetota bacterium]
MKTLIEADPMPLRVDEDGAIRVGDSRVTLDVILAEHRRGVTPEQIAEEYDTVNLADIYAALGYCLRHGEQIAAYLDARRHEAAALKKKLEDAGISSQQTGEVIRQRWADQESQHASPHD